MFGSHNRSINETLLKIVCNSERYSCTSVSNQNEFKYYTSQAN